MLRQAEISQFKEQGFLIRELLGLEEVRALAAALDEIERERRTEDPALTFAGSFLTEIYDVPKRKGVLSRLVRHPKLLETVVALLGGPVEISAGLMIDKPEVTNWEVGWHQDTSVYSQDIPDNFPGEMRGGLPTFRPLDDTMSKCVTARIAIDVATMERGNLFILPGTHKKNVWPDGAKAFANETGMSCSQPAGSVLYFCPLIMHRAEKNCVPGTRRRVIHLTYRPANLRLPGSDWYPWPHPRPLTPLEDLWSDI